MLPGSAGNSMSLEVYRNKSVMITGNTGFKGRWLTCWLNILGSCVSGFSIDNSKSDFSYIRKNFSAPNVDDFRGDIRDSKSIADALLKAKPEIIFHMAAQSLVRHSYQFPKETWDTNVSGTVNLLEAAMECPSVRAVIVVTTDKCYRNREWNRGYTEDDELGGNDPYSASKAATELVVSSYRHSFKSRKIPILLASVRAGNVIGGGDWSSARLFPDVVRSVKKEQPLIIRNPNATRPWQHVLDCLRGYLMLGGHLLLDKAEFASAWNFGPDIADNKSVTEVLNAIKYLWPCVEWEISPDDCMHESQLLYLDSSKANDLLGWKTLLQFNDAIAYTADWYDNFFNFQNDIIYEQIKKYSTEIR